MPKIPPEKLSEALADGIPPVAVIAGPEEFLRHDALETIRLAAGAELERRSERAPAEADLTALFDDLRTPSLFGGVRLVVVDPAEKWLALDPDPWLLALARPWSSGHLVLVAEAIDGRTKLGKALAQRSLWVQVERPFHRPPPWQPNARPWENDMNRWTVARARRLGLAIDPPTAQLLIGRAGARLSDIAAALDRFALVLAPRGEKKITAEHVLAHTPEGEDASLFEVVDALFLGDRAGALHLARELLRRGSLDEKGARGVDPTGLLLQCIGAALSRARQLRAWHESRARGANDEEAAAEVGVARPFLPRLRQQAAATTPAALERAIDRLIRADCDLKSGAGPNAEELLERIAAGT